MTTREGDDARHARGTPGRPRSTLKRVGQVDGARVGAKGVEQRVLDDDREAERDQQDVAVLAVRGRADDEALQPIAEQEEQRRQADRGEIGIEPEHW